MIDANSVDPMPDGDPIALTQSVPVPPFPAGSLPPQIRAMVETVSEATQTDPAMAGTSALTALSACTGGHAVVNIRNGWREPLHIYAVTVAAPGERKSAVQQLMIAPIYSAESDLVKAGQSNRIEAESAKQIAEKEYQRRCQAAARDYDTTAAKDAAQADAVGARMLLEQIVVPEIPRLVADDITPEAAASMLAAQGGRLAIISAEGGIFDIIWGRYSAIPNMDLWLKGHAGDPLRVDRKGRAAEVIPQPALTLGLMIQPAMIDTIAARQDFRGRGLLARFMYARPVSRVGHRKIGPPPVDEAVQKDYTDAVQTLAANLAG
jgi:replicative DNA helicase